MKRSYYFNNIIIKLVLVISIIILGSCKQNQQRLVLYAGKGLKLPIEEIKKSFEQEHGIPISVIYAGSNTLLTTITRTKQGDVFIPGSLHYIKVAGKIITEQHYICQHVPIFAVKKSNSKGLNSFHDLLRQNVTIALANKRMAALGRVAAAIAKSLPPSENFHPNVIITTPTVNDLIPLITNGEVDAALIWADMLKWEGGAEIKAIELPAGRNKIKEIVVGTLSFSRSPKRAKQLTQYIATKGKEVFAKHGFAN
jgi:molybdate transport system substrate-binding protein